MSRDIQFAGFAKAVYEEIRAHAVEEVMQDRGVDHTQNATTWSKIVTNILAQRAYDLAYHVMSEVSIDLAAYNEGGELVRRENMRYIPDLTELPEVSE